MRYIVREPGKSGGAEYMSADDAIDAVIEWHRNTGIHCEIWIRLYDDIELHSNLLDVEASVALSAEYSADTSALEAHN